MASARSVVIETIIFQINTNNCAHLSNSGQHLYNLLEVALTTPNDLYSEAREKFLRSGEVSRQALRLTSFAQGDDLGMT
jgi:hypothetical protein